MLCCPKGQFSDFYIILYKPPTSPRPADPVDFPAADPPLLAPLAGFAEEMARYECPPIFSGDKDPKEWLESYESAAQHNGWAADARLGTAAWQARFN